MKQTIALSLLALLVAAMVVGCSNKDFPNYDTEAVHTSRYNSETAQLKTNYAITLATSADDTTDGTSAAAATPPPNHTVDPSWSTYQVQKARALLYNIVSHAERLIELDPHQTVTSTTTIADARAWISAFNDVLSPPPPTSSH